jgi:ABC-type amino acid transport substrate-binding protein
MRAVCHSSGISFGDALRLPKRPCRQEGILTVANLADKAQMISLIVAALLANIGTAEAQQGPDPRIADLVQAGKVRMGLFSTQYTKDPVTGEFRSVRVEIALALAARIGVPAVLLEHRTPPDVVQCLKAGACDVVFLPRDERAANVGDFSPPYLQSEYTMLVPAGSSIRSIADADKPGIRIVAVRSHSSTMTLTSAIKQAEVILGENELAAFELLRSGQADAFASTRQYLLRASKNLAGSMQNKLPMHLSRRCGARTRSGSRCRSAAMPNGRCRMHGGMSPGAPKGNKNAFKHGHYTAEAIATRREIAKLLGDAKALVKQVS